MGNVYYWILASFAFGIISGGFYTWMSPRRMHHLRLFFRSSAAYTAVGLAVSYLLFLIF